MAGQGDPLVVLINGSGGPLEGWHRLFIPLAAQTEVLAYNRPGVGGSAAPRRAQTLPAMVEDLQALLQHLRPAARLLLVGHSFGGLIANLYARLHAPAVAGVMLLEATAPADVLELPRHQGWLQARLNRLAERWFPLPVEHETRHAETSVQALTQAPPFPAVPLRVVSGGRPAMAWATPTAALALRARHQQDLLALSPLAQHQLAERSGHFPQLSEPELVCRSLLELIETTRGQS